MADAPHKNTQDIAEHERCASERIWHELSGQTHVHARIWMVPEHDDFSGDVLDVPNLGIPFDRSELNSKSIQGFGAHKASVGKSIAISTQIQYLAAKERAFRARHMTPVRAAAHAAARRRGHSRVTGVHTGDAIGYIQNLFASGESV